jgi:serine/threonine-protein kinase
MAPVRCPDPGTLRALLSEGGRGGEPDEVVRHLETCADCQRTLETLAAEPALWEETARGLVDGLREEPALHRLVEQLRSAEPVPADEPDVSFLRPADRPGLLGLLGPYEVQEEIGRGGMGVVLKALDPELNRVVAIKVLSPCLAASPTARRRFVREAQAAAAVRHEHVVAVHRVAEADGLPYLVMPYVPGESLQERLVRLGPLELAEVVRIGAEAAAGLAAAHARGLIHRDVKPANLLLEGGPARVKITDFGLARAVDDVGLTRQGVVAGTPEYMAPEQARGAAIDHRADLYALGCVLYACCTGAPPFRGETPLAVLRQVSDQVPAPLRERNPEVPAWLEALVARLLAKDPADRFQSAAEVAALLEGYLARPRQPAPPPHHPSGQGDTEMAFACSSCGTSLKAKAELAGKKVKCPRCSQAVLVPGPAAPKRARSLAWGAGLVVALGLVLALLAVWRGRPGPGTPPSFLNVTLGSQFVPGVEESGFYNEEANEDGPFRWTDGKARLVIPVDPQQPPQALLVQLHRPKNTWLQIAINDREVVNEPAYARPMPWWQRLVDLTGIDRGDKLIVEIRSNTVVPQSVDPKQSQDTRALGVKVRGIKLLPEPGEKTSQADPLLLNIAPGEPSIPGVEESGLYYEERDPAGLFRWTDGKARLVIPVNPKEPAEALLVRLDWPQDRYLKITVNNRELVNEVPNPRAPRGWERTFGLGGIELGERLVLEIASGTSTPRKDDRVLGVQVREIKLRRGGGGDKTAAGAAAR